MTVLYASSADGSSIVTGTNETLDSFTVTCGAQAKYPLTWWLQTMANEYATQTVQPGQQATHVFATPLAFVQATLKGSSVQQPPVKFFGVAQAVAVTPPTATTVGA